jgi:hypothetical protein
MTIDKYVYQLHPIYLGELGLPRIWPAPIGGETEALDVYPWKPSVELARTIEPHSFSIDGKSYYPVWIEGDGTEWASYEVWECCEHADDTKKIEEYCQNIDLNAPSPFDCSSPVEFAGGGRQLCGKHFEEIKARSRVRWAPFEGEDYS